MTSQGPRRVSFADAVRNKPPTSTKEPLRLDSAIWPPNSFIAGKKLITALEQGSIPDGPMIARANTEEADELRSLAELHVIATPFALLLTDQDPEGPALEEAIRVHFQDSNHKVRAVVIRPLRSRLPVTSFSFRLRGGGSALGARGPREMAY